MGLMLLFIWPAFVFYPIIWPFEKLGEIMEKILDRTGFNVDKIF